MTVTPEMVDQATMPDELYAVTGLTTGIATARTLTAEMSIGDLMQHREMLVEMQDAAACALQRLDKHMDDLGRMIRIEQVSALSTAAPLGEVA